MVTVEPGDRPGGPQGPAVSPVPCCVRNLSRSHATVHLPHPAWGWGSDGLCGVFENGVEPDRPSLCPPGLCGRLCVSRRSAWEEQNASRSLGADS